jgi:hypothetical protein
VRELLLHSVDRAADEGPHTTADRLRPDNFETIWLWDDAQSSPLLIPKNAAQALTALLDVANGRRLVATSSTALAGGKAARRTTLRGLNYLEQVGFLTAIERSTWLRRVRLQAGLGSFEMKLLSPLGQSLLRALYKLANGQKTITVSARQLTHVSGLSKVLCAQTMLQLIKRAAIAEVTPPVSNVTIFRINVRRRVGRGLQLAKLPDYTDETDPLIIAKPRDPRTSAAT